MTIVLGVNDDGYDREQHHIVSNASCTTNCVAPLAKVLHDSFGIERGFMTTIHAYTNDQQILGHARTRTCAARARRRSTSIPTSTGAAQRDRPGLPDLKGKVDGMSMRAPVPTGSITDLVVAARREVTADEVNEAYRAAADVGPLEGILQYADDPLVSTDIVGNRRTRASSTATLTMANGNAWSRSSAGTTTSGATSAGWST